MFFYSPRKCISFTDPISLASQGLVITKTYKYLGVLLDSHLSYREHISKLWMSWIRNSVNDKIRSYLSLFLKRTYIPCLFRITCRAMLLHIIFRFKKALHQRLLHFSCHVIWDKCISLGQSHGHSSQSLHTKTPVVWNPSFIHAPKFGMTFLITSELYHLPHISKDMQTTPSQHLYLHSLIVHVLFKYCLPNALLCICIVCFYLSVYV